MVRNLKTFAISGASATYVALGPFPLGTRVKSLYAHGLVGDPSGLSQSSVTITVRVSAIAADTAGEFQAATPIVEAGDANSFENIIVPMRFFRDLSRTVDIATIDVNMPFDLVTSDAKPYLVFEIAIDGAEIFGAIGAETAKYP